MTIDREALMKRIICDRLSEFSGQDVTSLSYKEMAGLAITHIDSLDVAEIIDWAIVSPTMPRDFKKDLFEVFQQVANTVAIESSVQLNEKSIISPLFFISERIRTRRAVERYPERVDQLIELYYPEGVADIKRAFKAAAIVQSQ